MNSYITYPLRLILISLVGVMLSITSTAGDLNRIDQSGQRQGYWIILGENANDKKYKPGDKVEEGVYKDNVKEGLWKKYWPNGKLRSEITYREGRPSGVYRLHYENGNTEEQGFWINSKNTGEFKRFYPNGNMQQWFLFSETGRRNGLQKYYHENGKLSMEVTVINGLESGVSKRYSADGVLIEEKTFDKGVLNPGSIKKYSDQPVALPVVKSDPYDKQIGKESQPAQDKTNKAEVFRSNGYNTLYNRNGQITQIGEFKNGKLCNGKWYHYNDSGLLIKIEIYKHFKYVGTAVIE